MEIACKECGYTETVSVDLFVKIIGAALPVGGYWAWVTYLFAGTGFALQIVVAIITGGVAMLAFKDEIVEWIIEKGYECTKCGAKNWEVYITDAHEKSTQQLRAKDSKLSSYEKELCFLKSYEKEISLLKKDLRDREQKIIEYTKAVNESFSYSDVEPILREIDEKDKRIEDLKNDNEELSKLVEAYKSTQKKLADSVHKRFNSLYRSLSFTDSAIKRISDLDENQRLLLEKKLALLNISPEKINFRDKIEGTDVYEIGFGKSGRLYIRRDAKIIVVCVGDKKTQSSDIKQLKRIY